MKVKDLAAKYSVAIGTPLGTVCPEYLKSLWSTINFFNGAGMRHGFLSYEGAIVEKTRNFIAGSFLDSGFSHIMWIDGDQAWDPMDIMRLLAHEKQFIGAAVRKKTDDVQWNCNFMTGQEVDESGLLLCQELGTGFVLMDRNVFLRLQARMPEMKITSEGDHANLYRYFYPEVDNEGKYWGEDLNFSRQWRKRCQGMLWVDVSLTISHYGRKDFRGCLGEDLLAKQEVARAGKTE